MNRHENNPEILQANNWRLVIVIALVCVIWISLSLTAKAEVVGSRPAGCPKQFCGCALSLKLYGVVKPHLNLAANWIRYFPRTSPAPGMVVARRGHVMQLVRHVKGHRWVAWTANSCGRRICIQERSIARYVAVNPYMRTASR